MKEKSPKIYGFPKRAKTYGDGGGHAIMMKSGPFIGWLVGGGNRSEVYGKTYVFCHTLCLSVTLNFSCSFHPETPALNTLPWGFFPIATSLDVYPSDSDIHPVSVVCYQPQPLSLISHLIKYYQSLPREIPRPGGELVEMKITLLNDGSEAPPFFFISDLYTALEIRKAINKGCYFRNIHISPPILFNSTGNIKLGNVVQYYRGDSAAIVLQGYDNSEELPGRPDLIYSPPFPPNVSYNDWQCINTSIGDAIPTIHGETHFPVFGIDLSVALSTRSLILFAVLYWYFCVRNNNKRTRTPNDKGDNLVCDSNPESGNDKPSKPQEFGYETKAKSDDPRGEFESTKGGASDGGEGHENL